MHKYTKVCTKNFHPAFATKQGIEIYQLMYENYLDMYYLCQATVQDFSG